MGEVVEIEEQTGTRSAITLQPVCFLSQFTFIDFEI